MARSSNEDPIDKFRFQIVLFETANFSLPNELGPENNLSRAGFSEIALPNPKVTEMTYRENLHGSTFVKLPGLVRYDPISLRRGTTNSQDLYNWYKLVNNDGGSTNAYLQALSSFSVTPFQNLNFRRDILISALNRQGNFVKHWMLFNAFPVSYKGGDDFSASAEEKLVEELTVTYETFVEVIGDSINEALNNVSNESTNSLNSSLASAAIGAATGALGGLF